MKNFDKKDLESALFLVAALAMGALLIILGLVNDFRKELEMMGTYNNSAIHPREVSTSTAVHPVEVSTSTGENSGGLVSTGMASWYDYRLNGVWWSKNHATAASRTLERYNYYKVINPVNNRSVVVFINDFGPQEWTGREIDLSSYAFSQISDLKLGLVNVKIEKYVE